MPEFLPFPALRFAASGPAVDLSARCSPPYDVIEPDQRAALEARDPHNAVRLILPDAYDAAAAALAQWRADGVLVTDDAPTFSIYRMDFTGDDGIPQRTTGVLGALALDDDGSGVMPHERTLPKAKTDRLELLRATRANLDPIWGLSLAGGLSSHLSPGDAEPDPALAGALAKLPARLFRERHVLCIAARAEDLPSEELRSRWKKLGAEVWRLPANGREFARYFRRATALERLESARAISRAPQEAAAT